MSLSVGKGAVQMKYIITIISNIYSGEQDINTNTISKGTRPTEHVKYNVKVKLVLEGFTFKGTIWTEVSI